MDRSYLSTVCALLTLGLVLVAPDSWAKPKAVVAKRAGSTAHPDPATEWRLIDKEARPLLETVSRDPKNKEARQGLADLAIRATRGAERALARGDENLFRAYREQILSHFHETRWRMGFMAGQGDGAAEFALGTLALHGILEDVSIEQACARFAAALEKGFGGAKFRHAQCLEEKDPKQAAALLRDAADAGHLAAMESLGRQCLDAKTPDGKCASLWLGRAAQGGRASAKTLMGWMHAEGIGGPVNLPRAAQLYREAAQQGEYSARNNLGELLENGRGVARDERAAFEQYRLAAEGGFSPGQFNVGRLYAGGKGVEKNIPEARRWLGLAAKAGIGNAQKILDLLENDRALQRGQE